jgi:hypothetical protein
MPRTSILPLALCLAWPLAARAQAPAHYGRAIAPDAAVRIFNLAGTVRVTGWNRDSIDVSAIVPSGGGRLVFGGGSMGVKLGIDPPAGEVNYPGSLVEVRVSSRARVWIKTESAEILVAGLTSSADVSSVSGRVVVTGDLDQLSAESMDGGIDVQVNGGLVRLKSAGGAIAYRGTATDATVSTVSGAATMIVTGAERARMESVSGHLTFDAVLRAGGNYTLESHSGDISIRLPMPFDGALQATSLEGQVVNRLTRSTVERTNQGRGEAVATSTGKASAELTARSFKGTITLEAQTNP